MQSSHILLEINTSVSREYTLLLSTLWHQTKIWAQEVMSVCVPVRDKSDISHKAISKDKQIEASHCVCIHVLTCPVPSIPQRAG